MTTPNPPSPSPLAGPIQGDLPGQQALRDWVTQRARYWADPPYGPCTTPGCPNSLPGAEPVLLGDGDPRCATCRSASANRHQAEMFYPCDSCGAPEAFRDPAHRRDEYLCASCHLKNGYEPTERSMLNKTAARVGVTHSQGRRPTCILAGSASGTPCGGEVKQRASHGLICNRHWDPRKYDAAKG